MKPYDIYVFFLCLVVFSALTVLFSYLLREIVLLTIRVIKHGLEDAKLIIEYEKEKSSVKKKTFSMLSSVILCTFLIISFCFSLWVHYSSDVFIIDSSLKVVASSSMSKKNERNEYLFTNNLNNQFNTFDLIVTHPLPDEFDLKLYDVVVYKFDDMSIIHRIVDIEEPNNKHPGHRLFILQGDAISSPDREPVTYEQMRGIYFDERIPFIGSFVFFMRSPAGWLCILLILLTIISTPIVEKKIYRESMLRLYEIGVISEEEMKEIMANKKKWGKIKK